MTYYKLYKAANGWQLNYRNLDAEGQRIEGRCNFSLLQAVLDFVEEKEGIIIKDSEE